MFTQISCQKLCIRHSDAKNVLTAMYSGTCAAYDTHQTSTCSPMTLKDVPQQWHQGLHPLEEICFMCL